MDYDDIFPTRHGIPTGAANERQMLDHANGPRNIKTQIREDRATGTTTMLRTRAGNPEFTTIKEEDEDKEEFWAYMETGCLTNAGAFANEINRYLPARWRFVDIPPDGDWLGKLKSPKGKQASSQPTPIDTHKLRDDIDSLAVGYPRSTNPETDGNNKAKYQDKMILKKLCTGLYAPGIFSGKFRLWMQAQYGAHVKKFKLTVTVDMAGTPYLYYPWKNSSGDTVLWQITNFANDSVGLYTTSDFKYYVLHIQEQPSYVYQLKVAPLKFSYSGKLLLRVLRNHKAAGTLTPELQRKIEAYLFTESRIDLANETVAGSVTCPGPTGDTIQYGWKFNNDGSKASIVTHYQVSSTPNRHFVAREIHLNIHRADTGEWTITPDFGTAMEWIDGWGTWHIFKPDTYNYDANLSCFSNFNQGGGYRGSAVFTDVPIYGYYDKDDQWVAVKVTKMPKVATPTYELEFNNMSLAPGTSDADKQENFFNVLEYGAYRGDQSCSALNHKRWDITTSLLKVGGTTYSGDSASFRRYEVVINVSIAVNGGQGQAYDVYPYTDFFRPSGLSTARPDLPWPEYTYIAYPDDALWYDSNNAWGRVTFPDSRTASGYTYSCSGAEYNQWTLVIPPNESSAVLVATRFMRVPGVGARYTNEGSPTLYGQLGWSNGLLKPVGGPLALRYQPWRWEKTAIGGTATTDITPVERDVSITGYLHNAAGAVTGAPSTSYTTLFEVDYNNPYFNGTMYLAASYRDWYKGSESMENPTGIPSTNYIGWV